MRFGKKIAIPIAAPALAIALSMSTPLAAATNKTDETVRAADVRAEIAETVDTIGEYTAKQRDVAIASAEKLLADIDAALDRYENGLRENWDDLTEETKKKTRAAMEKLRQERNELADTVNEMKSGADSAWDDLVAGFSDAWDELEESWEETDNASSTSL